MPVGQGHKFHAGDACTILPALAASASSGAVLQAVKKKCRIGEVMPERLRSRIIAINAVVFDGSLI